MYKTLRTLPTHWAAALINGDFSGYEDDEIDRIQEFIDEMVIEYGQCRVVDRGEVIGDTHYHDAYPLGAKVCDVSIYTFDITRAE